MFDVLPGRWTEWAGNYIKPRNTPVRPITLDVLSQAFALCSSKPEL